DKAEQEKEAALPRPPPPVATRAAQAPAPAEPREAAPGTDARQPPRAEGASPDRAASHPSPSGERGGGGRRIAGVVVAGAGVAALAVGAYFALHAQSKLHASDLACPEGRCTMEGVTLNDEAKSAARAADFLIGGGLVAAAAATYLLLT